MNEVKQESTGLLDEKNMTRYKEGLWLTKDNKLIRMHCNMTALCYKLINYVLWKSMQEGRLDDVRITTAEIRDILEYRGNDLSGRLKLEAEKIVKTIVYVEDTKVAGKWGLLPLISKMEYDGERMLISHINPQVAPYIQGMTKNFTKTDYKKINTMSYPGMRLGEICNSWANFGYALYSINEWRELLGATNQAYKVLYDFKRRILNPAVKEVNSIMDFTVTPVEIKEKRKVTHIKIMIKWKNGVAKKEKDKDSSKTNSLSKDVMANEFAVTEKEAVFGGSQNATNSPELVAPKPRRTKKKDLEKAQQDFNELSDAEKSFVQRMVDDYDMSLPVAIEAIVQYGISYCTKQMELVRLAIKSGKKITNKGGYLRKAIEEGYAQSQEAIERAKGTEEADIKDKKLWDKQAKEFFYGKKKVSRLEDKTPEEIAYEKEYEVWEKKKNAFRFELIRMARDGKLEMEMINPAIAEFESKNPPPVKPTEKEGKEIDAASKIFISKLVDNFLMPSAN